MTSDRETAPFSTDLHQQKPPTNGSDRFRNSRRTNIAIGAGVAGFLALCLLLAFGGVGGSDTSDSAPTANESTAVDSADATSEAPVAAVNGDEDAAPQTTADTVEAVGAAEPEAAEPDAAEPDAAESEAAEPQAAEPVAAEPEAAEPEAAEPEPVEQVAAEPEAAEPDAAEPVDEGDTGDVEPPVRAGQLPPDVEPPARPLGAPEQYSILSAGKIFLYGTVPSIDIEAQIVSSLEPIIGRGNVISQYAIDSAAPFNPGSDAPVFIDDTVLFAPGSAVISEDFYPLLASAPFLLQLQPTATITITGHTDSDGSAEANLVLSQARVDAVRDWIIGQGGDGDRVIAIGVGEVEPVADNSTEAGRASNRRVQFLISGFDINISG